MRTLYFLLYFIISLSTVLLGSDWPDLHEGDRTYYGSERQEKFEQDGLFWKLERWDNHYSNQVFWLYKYTDYPKYQSTELFPFFYKEESKLDKRKSTRIFNSVSTQEMDSNHYTFFPFWFQGRKDNTDKTYYSLIPFFYTSSYGSSEKEGEDFKLITPLGYYQKTPREKDWFVPIIPLISGNQNETSSAYHIFWLINLNSTKQEGLKSFNILPLVYYGKENNERYQSSYFAFLPLYSRIETNDDTDFLHIFPLNFYWRNTSEKTGLFFPFFYYNKQYDEKKEVVGNTYIAPFFYKDSYKDQDTFYFLNYYNHERFGKDAEKDLYFFPFYFYNSTLTGNSRLVFPLFYREWKSDGSTYWNILGFMHWENDVNKKYNDSTIFPFYVKRYDKEKPEERGQIYGFPYYISWSEEEEFSSILLWYSNTDKKSGNFFKMFLPLYYKWKSENSEANILLPISLEYKDKESNETYDMYLLGLLKENKSGFLQPDMSIDFGKKEGFWYMDTDISFLYYFARYSSRITGKNPFAGYEYNEDELKKAEQLEEEKKKIEEKKELQDPLFNELAEERSSIEENKAALSKYKTIDRENSLSFNGLNLFFGIFAYEKADTKTHTRVFPLYWLSWDETSEDRVQVIPPIFVWYKDLQKEYYVFFPFYGKQEEGKSFIKSYGLFAYIDEYDETEDRKEISVVWPFFNKYTMKQKNGHRLLPFYYHTNELNESGTISDTVSILYYYSKTVHEEDKTYNSSLFVYPIIFYQTKDVLKDKEITQQFSILLPHFYDFEIDEYVIKRHLFTPFNYHENHVYKDNNGELKEDYFHEYLFFAYYTGKEYEDRFRGALFGLLGYGNEGNRKYHRALPFYSYSSNEKSDSLSLYPLLYFSDNYESESDTYYSAINPLYYYKNTKSVNKDSESKKEAYIFPLLFYYNSHPSTYNFLFLIHNKTTDSEKVSYFLPFYFYNTDYKDSFSFFLFGYYREKNENTDSHNFLYLFRKKETTSGEKKSEYALLFDTFYSSEEGEKKQKQIFYGIVYDSLYIGEKNNYSDFFYFWSLKNTDTKTSQNFFPIFYQNQTFNSKSKEVNTKHRNILVFYDTKEVKNRLRRFILFPYGYFGKYQYNSLSNEPYETSHFLFPFYYDNRTEKKTTLFITPLYLNWTENTNEQNLLYLYHREKYENGESYWSFIFHSIYYDNLNDTARFKLLYGFLTNYRYKNSDDFSLHYLGIFGYTRNKERHESNFFPIYYNDEIENKSRFQWYGAGIAFYHDEDDRELFQHSLLGILYYRSKMKQQNEDTLAILAGTLYYSKAKKIRGYNSSGSLWGWLWEYETESETDFYKFSVLKFFGLERIKGKTKYKILGIKF